MRVEKRSKKKKVPCMGVRNKKRVRIRNDGYDSHFHQKSMSFFVKKLFPQVGTNVRGMFMMIFFLASGMKFSYFPRDSRRFSLLFSPIKWARLSACK